jgi:hypothetical protein
VLNRIAFRRFQREMAPMISFLLQIIRRKRPDYSVQLRFQMLTQQTVFLTCPSNVQPALQFRSG